MPKLLYTWYFEKFTASVTSSGHSALRHEVSRICTILILCQEVLAHEKSIFLNCAFSINNCNRCLAVAGSASG